MEVQASVKRLKEDPDILRRLPALKLSEQDFADIAAIGRLAKIRPHDRIHVTVHGGFKPWQPHTLHIAMTTHDPKKGTHYASEEFRIHRADSNDPIQEAALYVAAVAKYFNTPVSEIQLVVYDGGETSPAIAKQILKYT